MTEQAATVIKAGDLWMNEGGIVFSVVSVYGDLCWIRPVIDGADVATFDPAEAGFIVAVSEVRAMYVKVKLVIKTVFQFEPVGPQ